MWTSGVRGGVNNRANRLVLRPARAFGVLNNLHSWFTDSDYDSIFADTDALIPIR